MQPALDSIKLYNFPAQSTSFIGREEEVTEISKLLADPACRLLTLIGAGGIGKTRLAIQGALEQADAFADGVYFVSLHTISSHDYLIPAIADAVKIPLSGQDDPEVLLLNYLHDKEMLLLLDNFEQLLGPLEEDEKTGDPGTVFLSDILEVAPGVKLLVTSREVLNLQEEWLYPVPSLAVPSTDQADNLEDYSAVQLFIERARQVRRDFEPDEARADIVRICRLVEGMPLAIEIAASWTKTLQCDEIAAEIQQNIDFLTTSLRNIPDRQRSMRAIFDQSWQFLTQEERDVFKRLSVFRGSFEREAAKRIAGASLAILSTLVDKSLLRLTPEGRYHIHELLRQYAIEQLVESPEAVSRIYDAHSTYYATFLHQRTEELQGGDQLRAVTEIAAELENVRFAWQWAVQQVNVEDIKKAAFAYYQFCDFQGRFQEGADAFEAAIEKLESADLDEPHRSALATLHVLLGFHHIRLGRFENAQTCFERSQTLFEKIDRRPPYRFGTDPLSGLGLLNMVLGNYAEAATIAEEARQQNRDRADKHNLQISFYVLADANSAQGKYETGRYYAQQAYVLTEQTHNRWMRAYILTLLGNVARLQGDYDQAEQHYQASYAIKQEFNDPEGMAAALNHLGQLALVQENNADARRLYQQAVSIYQGINDRGGLATALNGLGVANCALHDYGLAQEHLQQALQITLDMEFVPLTLTILTDLCELLWQTGQGERAIELLALVLQHPASDHETKKKAESCLSRYEAKLTLDEFAAAWQRGQHSTLESATTVLQAELAMSPGPATSPIDTSAQAERQTPQVDQPLVEPLTPRELEVLQLMAQGLTNQQIADELIISVGTAKWYTGQIYGKLNVSNRTQAVARARELDMLA